MPELVIDRREITEARFVQTDIALSDALSERSWGIFTSRVGETGLVARAGARQKRIYRP